MGFRAIGFIPYIRVCIHSWYIIYMYMYFYNLQGPGSRGAAQKRAVERHECAYPSDF